MRVSKEKKKLKNKDYLNKELLNNSNSGITLVALVVTIIVLLILAGVSLSMVFSQQGIFNRAENAVDKHSQSKARETLDLVFSEVQMKKYDEGLTEDELNKKIEEVGELIPKEDETSKYQLVIVDGYIFEIDRSVPKVVEYKGPADGIIITATISGNNGWVKPGESVTVKGSIKIYGEGSIASSSATSTNSSISLAGFPSKGGDYTISNITEDTDIKITAIDSTKKSYEKTVKVVIKRDTTPPTINEFKVSSVGLKIRIEGTAIDNESGLANFTYIVTPPNGKTATPTTGSLTSGKAEVTASDEGTYTVTVTATDNASNPTSQNTTVEVVDGGVLKHIKTTEGLKEVNTKDIYGATVNGYTCSNAVDGWQIFYIDEEDDHRVYLIASNYVTLPTEVEILNGSAAKAYYWNSTILNKYNGTIPNTPFEQKFLSDFAGKNTSTINLQATNYMLEQSIWSGYLMSGKSESAYGGPTLPLFQSSFNDVCRTKDKIGLKKEETGYLFDRPANVRQDIFELNLPIDRVKGIYGLGTGYETACYMWIASPYAGYDGSLCSSATTLIFSSDCTFLDVHNPRYEGFRPVVRLRSDIEFIDNGNNTYTIK